jgi:hypothetical protein
MTTKKPRGSKSSSQTAKPVRPVADFIAERLQRVGAELRSHRTAYLLMVAFAIAGMLFIPQLFPGVERAQGALGGLLFGAFGSMCAMPGQFYED